MFEMFIEIDPTALSIFEQVRKSLINTTIANTSLFLFHKSLDYFFFGESFGRRCIVVV